VNIVEAGALLQLFYKRNVRWFVPKTTMGNQGRLLSPKRNFESLRPMEKGPSGIPGQSETTGSPALSY
jgi:hypothetical protein